jgi:hypothetical protein
MRSFMNTPDERHAFAIGLCEIIAPWPPRHRSDASARKNIAGEYHYYMFGRAIAVILWLIIAKLVQEAFW